MGKMKPRKTIVAVGKRCPSYYEINKTDRDQAIEVAKNCPYEIKNKNIKYDVNRRVL